MKQTEYLRPEVIQRISRLDLKARFIVEGFLAGLHDSPFHGFSVEFSEHRKYDPGDDPKYIDWKVFCKTDKFYVKEFKAETTLVCTLAVDVSRSMRYRSGAGLSKLEYAACLAGAIAYLMIQQRDAVALATFDQNVRNYVPPRSKRLQLGRIFTELDRSEPTGGTDIARALHLIAGLIRARGLVVLFSDLLADPAPVLSALHRLRHEKHDVIVFHILDSAEVRFPFTGPTRFEDPESKLAVQADARSIRSAYLDELNAFIERYKTECARAKIGYVQMDTAVPFDKALTSYLLARQANF